MWNIFRLCCSDFPNPKSSFESIALRSNGAELAGEGGRRRNDSRAYFSNVYIFFQIILFPSHCHSLNMQHQTDSFMEKMYILCINTDKTDVATDSHNAFHFRIYGGRNPHFSRKILFFRLFCSFSR